MRLTFLQVVVCSTIASFLWTIVQADPPLRREVAWEPVPELTDDFDSTDGLNLSKWSSDNTGRYMWRGRMPSQFRTENAWVQNGTLNLKSTLVGKYSRLGNATLEIGDADVLTTHWVDTARVYGLNKMAEHGMYFEASIKASDTAVSSAFWFRMSKFSEIDVVEHIGHATSSDGWAERSAHEFAANTHVFGKYKASAKPVKHVMKGRGRDGFNTYGLYWVSPRLVIFYLNDREVMRSTTQECFDEKLVLIFDTEVLYPAGNGLPTGDSLRNSSRNTMQVDWVRSYRMHNSSAGLNETRLSHARSMENVTRSII